MMGLPLLSLIVAAPFVAAVLLFFIPDAQRALVRWVSLSGAAVALAGSVQVARVYDMGKGGLQLAERYPLVPSLGIELSMAVDS